VREKEREGEMIFEGKGKREAKGKRDEEERGEMGEGNGSDFLTVPDMLLFVACDSSPILEGKKGGLSQPQKFSLPLCFCLFLHKNVRFSPLWWALRLVGPSLVPGV